MLKSIFWYINLVFSMIARIPKQIKATRLYNNGKQAECEEFANEVAEVWGRDRIKLSGSRITVHGLENLPTNSNMLFVSNHQSNFDIFLILSEIPVPKGFIAKTEILKIPIVGFWMQHINCLFMDRNDMKQSMKVILQGIEYLKNGKNLVIFPEGTRSRCSQIGEFKAGSFKLATKSKVPIVPLTINGTYNIMEANKNRIKAADVELFIHPPIETANLSKEEITALPEKVKKIIASKLPD